MLRFDFVMAHLLRSEIPSSSHQIVSHLCSPWQTLASYLFSDYTEGGMCPGIVLRQRQKCLDGPQLVRTKAWMCLWRWEGLFQGQAGEGISEMGVLFNRHPYLQFLPNEDFGHWSRELVVNKLMLGEEVSFHYSKGEQGNQHHLCFSWVKIESSLALWTR